MRGVEKLPYVSHIREPTLHKRMLALSQPRRATDLQVGDYVYFSDLPGMCFYKVKRTVADGGLLFHGILYSYYDMDWWKQKVERDSWTSVKADQMGML